MRVLFLDEEASAPPPAALPLHAQRVISVSAGVMKRLAGVDNVAGLGAVAELNLPRWRDLLPGHVAAPGPETSRVAQAVAGPTRPSDPTACVVVQRLVALERVQVGLGAGLCGLYLVALEHVQVLGV